MTIRATASPCPDSDPDAFAIATLPLPATLLKDGAGEELAIRCGRVTIRLSIEAGTLLDGAVRLDYRIGGRSQLARRLLALTQYDAMLRLGRVPRAQCGKDRRVARPALMLRTLDALAVTTGTRGVAVELFGAEAVDADWDHESDYMRSQTRRLIVRARRLATSGYLKLLK